MAKMVMTGLSNLVQLILLLRKIYSAHTPLKQQNSINDYDTL